MNKKIARFLCALLLTLCGAPAFSQLKVSTAPPYNTPTYLVENVLLGEGVKASNFTFYGNPKQIGYFSKGKSSIGLDEGIILSTGNVDDAMPPQPTPAEVSTSYAPGPNQGNGDADLLKVANLVPKLLGKGFTVNPTYDAAILEFDFIPSSDSVVFKYVFASEEYLKWIDTKYNDAFGFFISGPGIDGEYSSPAGFPDSSQNIALIPGTNIPITVSSVNNKSNTGYFINNPANLNITYNGYTTVFTAYAKVQPCQVYHIQIAIADGSKNDYDSGVMIEARSFSSGNITLQQNIPIISNGAALEGCFSSHIAIRRESVKSYNDTVYVSVDPLSQATIADITTLPPYIVIPAGQDSALFNFSFVEDGLNEGVETMLFDFHLMTVCADLHRSFTVKIADAPALQFINPLDENINLKCSDTAAFLDARLKDGYGFYTYKWEANGVPIAHTDSVYYAHPLVTTTYRVTAGDTCNLGPLNKSFTVVPANLSPLTLAFANDTIVAPCKGKDFVVKPGGVTGGGGVSGYTWSRYGTILSRAKDLVIQPDTSSYYTLMISDSCNNTASDSVFIKVFKTYPIQIVTSNDTTLCSEQDLLLTVSAIGGAGKLYFNWTTLNDTSRQVLVRPPSTTQYPVVVSDDCQSERSKTVYVKVNEVHADFDYTYHDDFGVEVQNFTTGKELSFSWELDRELVSTAENPVFEISDLENHNLELKAYDSNGCMDTLMKVLLPPMFVYIPNSFTPNDDGINDVFNVQVIDPVEFEMTIFDRWGGEVFSTKDPKAGWNGITPGSNTLVLGNYIVLVKAARKNNVRVEQRGVVTLIP